MPEFHLIASHAVPPDARLAAPLPGSQGAALLHQAGVQWGRAPQPALPTLTEPRLRHARALIALQREFGLADRVVRRRREAATAAEVQLAHDALSMVVQGSHAWLLPVPELGGWLQSTWQALEWFTLPAGLRYRFSTVQDEPAAERLVLQRGLHAAGADRVSTDAPYIANTGANTGTGAQAGALAGTQAGARTDAPTRNGKPLPDPIALPWAVRPPQPVKWLPVHAGARA